MSQLIASHHSDYRGYGLEASHYASGWRVHIIPGPRSLPTDPDHVLADTQEEALTKARAIVDRHLQG
ncbi:hypothetical protein USDA257_p01030 (plasmid) [Sinorhizobium fredii USDA 257]|uniref:Uncharacterized protein n=1 Tax=Sinorhizobium fredii (strain USDA 257) TaxID=1185652 RepID=I3XG15_SINF2|nr:hypothetical protein USDA257_p01030 [Sinorhizobium fredii USDA 257]